MHKSYWSHYEAIIIFLSNRSYYLSKNQFENKINMNLLWIKAYVLKMIEVVINWYLNKLNNNE